MKNKIHTDIFHKNVKFFNFLFTGTLSFLIAFFSSLNLKTYDINMKSFIIFFIIAFIILYIFQYLLISLLMKDEHLCNDIHKHFQKGSDKDKIICSFKKGGLYSVLLFVILLHIKEFKNERKK